MAEATEREAEAGVPAPPPPVGALLPLAESKLAPPRQQPDLVQRPRILRALDATDGVALTLLSAPAGYGKTTAVRAWSAGRQAPLAWVTLDDGDNDPVRLWTYVATAVDRVREGLGRAALQRLRVPGAAMEAVVDDLMNGIASLGSELVLVLEDFQAVTERECLSSLDRCIGRLPPLARLVVVTRSDPFLGLARLRAQGALAELRASDLAFTTSEARELIVDRAGIQLEAEEIDLLHRRTEGWPAALFLAGLWLRTVDDAAVAVRGFGGDQRFQAEFLSQEVLAALDDDLRSFLLRASELGRFTARMCDAVMDRTDSAEVLAELERSNLLIVRLERGGWFRMHSLFAGFAASELATVDASAAADLHRRATRWLRSQNLPVEATEHALAAGDVDVVAELLVEHHLVLIRQGAARTLLRWVHSLPEETLIRHPELPVAAATATTMIGHSILNRRRLLQLADRARDESPARYGPYVQAVAGMVRAAAVDDDVRTAVAEGGRAVETAKADADDVLVAALAGYARALYFAGDLDQAWLAAKESIEHPDADGRPPGHAFARCTLALVAVELGNLAPARLHAEKAKSIVGGVRSNRSWLGANAAAALGSVLAAEGALAEAERELAYAEHFFREELPTVHHAWMLVLLARVRSRRGRLDDARSTLRTARDAIADLADAGRIPSLVSEVANEIDQAGERARRGELLEPPSEAELSVLRLLSSDLSSRQIAATLFLSPNTVRSHTRAIYRKLGVNSRADAVARADALGLLGEAESPT